MLIGIQIKFLKKIGCDYVQGYYYGCPMSLEALTEKL